MNDKTNEHIRALRARQVRKDEREASRELRDYLKRNVMSRSAKNESREERDAIARLTRKLRQV